MRHLIGFVIYDGFQLQQAAAAIGAFELCDSYQSASYSTHLLSTHGGMITSSAGVSVLSQPLGDFDRLDTLFIVGGRGWAAAAQDPMLPSFIRRQLANSTRLAAIATGSAILLASGIRPARIATHWARARDIAQLYPDIEITSDGPLVVEDNIWSAPSTGGAMDIAYAMIAQDQGPAAARRAMRDALPMRPRGAIARTETANSCRFHDLTVWAREHLQSITSISDLAERVGMHPTHFVPAFAAATGETPGKAMERLRMEAALEMMEAGDQSLARIAVAVGFQNAERMRRAFVRTFGQSASMVRESRSITRS